MSNSKLLQSTGLLLLLAMAIAFPLLFSNPAITAIAVFTLLFAAAATGWNIFSGYTGYIALGHAAYFGIGAYALAIMCQDWHIPGGYMPFLLVPVAGLLAAIAAIPLGGIALRVRRHTFVVITIAMFFILQLLAYNLRNITNGSTGMGLPIPTDWSGDFFNTPFYYVALAVLLFAIAISWWVRHSKYGLGLLAIRDDEDRALGLGVHVEASKLSAFVISAFIVGMVGAVWAYFVESIYPPVAFDALFDVAVTLMAFLGGVGTIAGPILGALLLEPTQQYFTLQFGQNYYLVIYGAMFLVVILLLPRGVIPTLTEYWTRLVGTRFIASAGDLSPTPIEPGFIASEQASSKEEQTREEGINL
ncbi:MAG TPA: branched-chain amino acid ABC transporter permease [Ktedonosporobacter sp.]|jgi:branched-chain amino acid transport system permease protein|nr:branched-chain amino acid ABC transporter permease [Ktedonosporobacter sp.]